MRRAPLVRRGQNRVKADLFGALDKPFHISPRCPTAATVCPPIIGDTAAYFDSGHMSYTYACSLAPELSAEFWLVMLSA